MAAANNKITVTMRVTDLTKQNAVLRNIQQGGERLQNIQESMASGKRINRISDDPIGATQAQDFRTKLSFFDTIRHNVKQNYIWLDRTEAELINITDLLSTAKSLVLSQINDTSNDASRDVTASEIESITSSFYESGNAKIGKVFIFSGSKTLTQPLEKNPLVNPVVISGENLKGTFKFLTELEQFKASAEGFSKNPYVLRIVKEGEMGRAHFRISDDGGESWSKPKTLLPDLELVNEKGKPSDKVMMHMVGSYFNDLGEPVIFPEGLEFKFEPNPPIEYKGNDDKRMAPTAEGALRPINLTAREILFKVPGNEDSVDIFDLLQSLALALRDNDPTTMEQRLGDLDKSFQQVLAHRSDVGSVRREMETQLDLIGDREFNNLRQLSELEDLDFPKAVTEMNLADVRYKATLDTSGRLIQPSLLNFLR